MKTRAGRRRETGAKRSRPTVETDPDCEAEPDSKKPKPNGGRSCGLGLPGIDGVMDIDSEGDLIVTSKSRGTTYLIDSNTLRRASPVLYEQCLAVRPADGRRDDFGLPDWVFDGMPDASDQSTEVMLHLIHANMGHIRQQMDFEIVQDAVYLAIQGEMFDRYRKVLTRWYQNIPLASPERRKTQSCCGLFLSHNLGLQNDFIELQQWAIFELCDNGNGGLGDPSEELFPGQPLDLAKLRLSDPAITNSIVKLRSKAVAFILTNLERLQLALLSTDTGRIGDHDESHGCQTCLDRWYGCLSRGLALPSSICGFVTPGFPSLFPVIKAEEYKRPLSELCSFVASLQARLDREQRDCDVVRCIQGSKGGHYSGPRFCSPPILTGRREEVISLINGSLTDSPGHADLYINE